jgi:hypothetical protein
MTTHSLGLIQSAMAADYIHDYTLSWFNSQWQLITYMTTHSPGLIQSMAADYILDYALSWFNTVNGN